MRPRSTLGLSLAFAFAFAAIAPIAGVARADDPQALGRALFDEGVALTKDGRWIEACPKFEASLKALPGIGTRGKLAECYEKVGRIASAWAMWKEVAALTMRAGEATREQIASEHVKALETKLSYVTIVVPPANAVAGLVVKRNGDPLGPKSLGQAEAIDPGPLTIDVSAPGRKAVTAHLLITQGQSATYEVPSLVEVKAPPPEAAKPEPARTSFPPAQADKVPWQKPVGLGAAGLGVVAIGVGSVLGLSAKSTYDKAFSSGACDSATKLCSASGQSDVDDARSKATLSTVAFVAGTVLAAGGLVLFFTAPSGARTALTVTPGPYGAGVTLGGDL